MPEFSESVVEEAVLDWFRELGYTVVTGSAAAPGDGALRATYSDVALGDVLRGALKRLNPSLPAEALQDSYRKLTKPQGSSTETRNRFVHRLLVNGVNVEYRRADGSIAGAQVNVLDFANAQNNDWVVTNQFTVVEAGRMRRLDVVVFVNGLPLALIELKNAADEDATIGSAFHQVQTYKAELPILFDFNTLLVISDGVEARIGTLTAGREWFKPWRTSSGDRLAPGFVPESQVIVEGVFHKQRLLHLIRDFVVFEESGPGLIAKKMAGYHQFHAVNVALAETLRAVDTGDRRIGVV